MFASRDREDKTGRHSCAITQKICGPAMRLQVTDLFFGTLFAFFIIELKSRRVIHVDVTRSPTDAWTPQQLREATPYGHTPKYLIRDNDSKFGPCFARVAATSGIKILKTPYHAPRANAICECQSSENMQKSRAKSSLLRTDVRSSHHRDQIVASLLSQADFFSSSLVLFCEPQLVHALLDGLPSLKERSFQISLMVLLSVVVGYGPRLVPWA